MKTLLPELTPSWWQPQLMWENYPHGLGWIDTLRHAGYYADNLMFGEPVPYSGALLPVFTIASPLDFSPDAIDCAESVNGQPVDGAESDHTQSALADSDEP